VDETGVRLVRGPLHWFRVVRDLNEGSDVRLTQTRTGLDVVALSEGNEVLVVKEVLHDGGPRHSFEPRSSSQSLRIRGVEQTFRGLKHLRNGRAVPLERQRGEYVWIKAFRTCIIYKVSEIVGHSGL